MSNKSISKPLPFFVDERLDKIYFDTIGQYNTNTHAVIGMNPQKGAVLMQNSDYLSLSEDTYIKSARMEAITGKNTNIAMSGIFLKSESPKSLFEKRFAEYAGMESCILTQSGWSANIGLLQTICAPNTHVYIDTYAHMSLWEGARNAGANIHLFLHNNLPHLRKKIQQYGKGLILVDSVYSTMGTVAPLEAMNEMAKEYNCALVVDESHSLGVFGLNGSGLVDELGLRGEVDFITASLAKSFSYRAGVIFGPQKLEKVLPFYSFPAIFSSTLHSHEIQSLDATLKVIKSADKKRMRLLHYSKKLREGLISIGFNIRSESQIVSLECGDIYNTRRIRDFIEENNVFGCIFCSPAMPKNRNIIRFSVNADMTDQDIELVLDVCKKAFEHPDFYFI